MFTVHIENVGAITVIECEGRIEKSECALKLHDAVTSQLNSRAIVLDLTGVHVIEGAGLGMLWFLQNWTQSHDIDFKLFNPTNSVLNRLECNKAMLRFDIATIEETVALLQHASSQETLAA